MSIAKSVESHCTTYKINKSARLTAGQQIQVGSNECHVYVIKQIYEIYYYLLDTQGDRQLRGQVENFQ